MAEEKVVLSKQVIWQWLKELGHPLTWADVQAFVYKFGFEKDEYFKLDDDGYVLKDSSVWTGAKWLASYWVVGGSEGYYVHVDRLSAIPDEHEKYGYYCKADRMLLGKFWTSDRAEEAANAVQQLINLA